MKKRYILSKTLTQIFIYLIEVIGMSILFAYLSTFIQNTCSIYDFIERCISCYTIYQILVVVILTNLNDIQKDLLLAYITNLKKCLLYIETRQSYIKSDILNNINYQLKNDTFNTNNVIKSYKSIKENIDNLNKNNIEMEIINAEHLYEFNSLNWRFSFLLRLLKSNKKKQKKNQ